MIQRQVLNEVRVVIKLHLLALCNYHCWFCHPPLHSIFQVLNKPQPTRLLKFVFSLLLHFPLFSSNTFTDCLINCFQIWQTWLSYLFFQALPHLLQALCSSNAQVRPRSSSKLLQLQHTSTPLGGGEIIDLSQAFDPDIALVELSGSFISPTLKPSTHTSEGRGSIERNNQEAKRRKEAFHELVSQSGVLQVNDAKPSPPPQTALSSSPCFCNVWRTLTSVLHKLCQNCQLARSSYCIHFPTLNLCFHL